MKYIICTIVFVTICGLFPRELQQKVPTIFTLIQLIAFIITIKLIKVSKL